MSRKTEEMQRELRVKLELCGDGNEDPEIRQSLRNTLALLREAKSRNPAMQRQMLETAQNLQEALRQGRLSTARLEAKRLEASAKEWKQKPGGSRSVMERLKKLFKPKKSQEDVRHEQIERQLKQAEDNIGEIKERLSRLSDQWEQCYQELQTLAAESVKMDKKNPRYAQLLAEAKEKQSKMKILEGQMKQFSAVLQNNTQYQTMLDNGRITLDLQALMPETAQAELLMEQIAQGAEDTKERIQDMDEILKKGNQRVQDAFVQEADESQGMDLFEQMQQEALNQSQAEARQKKEETGSEPAEESGEPQQETGEDVSLHEII
ncbi:MAG: hypothetical protein Q4F41_00240 [Eubacteriales bacterium]|nr:hypothetical protein [Eubacteriales bacterium]